MSWIALVPTIVAAIAIVSAILNRQYRQPHGRHQVKMDLEMLDLLPSDSSVRDELRDHIDKTLRRIVNVEDKPRRDLPGVGVGLVFLATAGALFYAASATGGEWWWLASAAFTCFVGLMIIISSGSERQRDLAGNSIAGGDTAKSLAAEDDAGLTDAAKVSLIKSG